MLNKVSVIIITWNAKHFLEKSLPSLFQKNSGFDFELIIIDNNSTDGTGDYVKINYPEAKYFYNTENKGVAPARNQGLKIASGKYILILDVDTEFITDNALDKLYSFMENNSDVGLIGAQLIGTDGKVQRSCLGFPSVWVKMLVRFENLPLLRNLSMFRKYYLLDRDLTKATEVDYVIGAFQFIRRDCINKIGLYDDRIFYGPEDIDFCLRLRKHGYKTIYYPDVKLFHYYQRITKKIFSKITLKHFNGLLHFFWKHKYINYPKI